MKPVIAIDGPAGSGKGTIARGLAKHFHFAHLDTGILYRTVAYLKLDSERLSKLNVYEFIAESNKIKSRVLRSNTASASASAVASVREIREIITKFLREFAKSPGDKYAGSVLDGRDIGTVVIPDSICKIFLTADITVRAKRRFHSLKQSNPKITLEEVRSSLEVRDKADSSREFAPLSFCEDYTLIDTSTETVEESLAMAIKIVKRSLPEINFDTSA